MRPRSTGEWPVLAGELGQAAGRGGPWRTGGKGIPGSTVSVDRGRGGKAEGTREEQHEFCLAGGKGAWREWREIRLQGLECRAKRGQEQAGLVVSLFTGSWGSF